MTSHGDTSHQPAAAAGKRFDAPDHQETSVIDPPAYPAPDDATSDDQPAPPFGWGPRIAIAAVVVVLAVIIILHLAGVVGPTAH